MAGRRLELDMEQHCTVFALKRKIADHWELPPICQTVALGQCALEDSHVLHSLQLAGSSPLSMTVVISNERLYDCALEGNMNQREMAVEDLAQVADRDYDRALHVLSRCTRDRIQKVRVASVNVLTKVAQKGDALAIDALRGCLGDRSREVRMDAVEALGRLLQRGDSAITDVLAVCFTEESYPDIRRVAVEILGDLATPGDARVLDLLRSSLNDRYPGVRSAAANAIAQVAVEAVQLQPTILALCQRLTDREWEVRSAALRALTAVHAERPQSSMKVSTDERANVLEKIRMCLEDDEPSIRRDAASFLVRLESLPA